MRKIFTVFSVICLSVALFACSKKDDEVFIGTYKGAVTYNDRTVENASVTVVKIGDNHYFRFSDKIPDIKNIKMKEGEDSSLEFDFEEGVKGIYFTDTTLWMIHQEGGNTWTVLNAKR